MIRRATILLMVATMSSCGYEPNPMRFEESPISTLGDGSYRYGATIDGEFFWWEVDFSQVEKTPDWSPATEPPLSVSQAVALATPEVAQYTNIPAAYRLEKVEWMHIGNHMPQKNKWIYLVTFERDYEYQERTFAARGTVTIPVLLDGTVIQARKEKAGA